MRLAPGEVDERGAAAPGGNDAQIDLESAAQPHARAGGASSEDALDLGQRDERVHDARRPARDDQQVGVADRLAPPPDGPGDHGRLRAGDRGESPRQVLHRRQDRGEQSDPGGRDGRQRTQDVLSLRSPSGHEPGARRGAAGEVVLDRADVQMQQQLGAGLEEGALDGEPDVVPIALLVALLPGQRQSVADVIAVAVGVDHVALDSSQHQVEHPAVLGVDLDQRAILGLDGLGGLLVRARLELDLVHLEIGGEVAEDARERSVVHDVDASRGTPRATGSPEPAAPAGPRCPESGM